MGHVFAEIELSNPRQPDFVPINANAFPMEDMDLVVNPGKREITVDPASPNIPHARVKPLAVKSLSTD